MPSKTSDVIVFDAIHKHYHNDGAKTHALKGISLTVAQGDFVAVMGRSGSGKSSLMNIVGLLDRHFEGEYRLDGVNVKELSDSRRSEIRGQKIGFVFQQFNLLKRTTVLDNVLLPTVYAGKPGDELQALTILKQVGLADYTGHYTNQLSGGQMQRVAIARALMMEPSILLADEPTGNLDTKTAHSIMELFQTINEAGTTVVVITHEDDIAAFAKRTVRLLDGKVEEVK